MRALDRKIVYFWFWGISGAEIFLNDEAAVWISLDPNEFCFFWD